MSMCLNLQSACTNLTGAIRALQSRSASPNATMGRDTVSSAALPAHPLRMLRSLTTSYTDIAQPISAPTNHTIYDLIFCGSLAGPFLLITTFLSHMFVVSLMAFTKILAHIVVKTLRTNLRRQSITCAGNDFGGRGSIACGLRRDR